MPDETIRQKAWNAHRLVSTKYTLDNYRETMYRHIKGIIENR